MIFLTSLGTHAASGGHERDRALHRVRSQDGVPAGRDPSTGINVIPVAPSANHGLTTRRGRAGTSPQLPPAAFPKSLMVVSAAHHARVQAFVCCSRSASGQHCYNASGQPPARSPNSMTQCPRRGAVFFKHAEVYLGSFLTVLHGKRGQNSTAGTGGMRGGLGGKWGRNTPFSWRNSPRPVTRVPDLFCKNVV